MLAHAPVRYVAFAGTVVAALQGAAAETIEIPFVEHPQQIMVPVTVNGNGPYNFTLDTGSAIGVCVDESLATKLKLPVTGQIGNSGGTGRVVERDLVRVDRMEVAGLQFTALDALAADYSWVAPDGSRDVDGILGFPLFRDWLLTIDYPRSKVQLSRGTLSAAEDHVVRYARADRRPKIRIEVDGERLTALLDTGSTSGIVLPDRLRESIELQGEPMLVGMIRSVNGFGGRVWMGRLEGDVRVAGHVLSAPLVSFVEGRQEAQLGRETLKDYVLTFDQQQRRLQMTRLQEE